MSVARVAKLSAGNVGMTERHNERKNTSYENVNVEPERIPLNISFKSAGDMTYNEYFDSLLAEGKISVRGLKADATHFNEMIIDVNTEYFEEHGGYEFAKKFYEEAYRFCCDFYGEECIVSAVMHADEINREVTDRLGRSVYHYHLHVVAIPTVEKEIRWSARCKDESLRGKVKAVVRQVSHSKKWVSDVPMTDENGAPVFNASGKPVFVKSYSVLQDRLFEHMSAAGFTGFERGVRGSTAEHLTSLQYQIAKDMERLNAIDRKVVDTEERLARVEVEYAEQAEIHKTYSEIDEAGKKSLGRYVMSKEDYRDLTALAKEGIASRGRIGALQRDVSNAQEQNWSLRSQLRRLEERYAEMDREYRSLFDRHNSLAEACTPFLEAMQICGQAVMEFILGVLPKEEGRNADSGKKAPENAPKQTPKDKGLR